MAQREGDSMKVHFADLWTTTGTIDRGAYALVGLLGFTVKHNLDRAVASYAFHRPWDLFNYWIPVRDVAHVTQLPHEEARFLGTMVTFALPFIWIGIALTMRRLRSAGLPSQLVAMFFVPFLNLLFFLVLCVLPARDTSPDDPHRGLRKPSSFARIVPDSAVGSAAISLLITVPLGLGASILASKFLLNYGWGLFVALPFTEGFAAALIYGIRQTRSLKSSVWVACLSTLLLGAALLGLAFEGAFCLIMAVPIALPLSVLGGVCAYAVQRRRWFQREAPAFLSVLLIFVPGIEWAEHVAAVTPLVYVVRTAIVVHAPPQRVWHEVVAFSEIGPPQEWLFRAGVAYPIRAEIVGSGPGAERYCDFSTGAFVEPIQVWDEPRLLKFSVSQNPPPMQEWTPYKHIEPAHLHGFLVSEGGQFQLTQLTDGSTLLEGTTWYRHSLWPASYWRMWSDAIIHRIHLRVLNHIREHADGSHQVMADGPARLVSK